MHSIIFVSTLSLVFCCSATAYAQDGPPDMTAQAYTRNTSVLTRNTIRIKGIADNYGHGQSAATRMLLKRSADTTITTSDQTLAGVNVPPINGRADIEHQFLRMVETKFEHEFSTRASSKAGTYYYGVCVEAVSGETNLANNCSGAVQIEVRKPHVSLPQGKVPGLRELERAREPQPMPMPMPGPSPRGPAP
ncbi:MAG: hypothetical protein V3S33_00830 [Gammaproteobacteria bacterium]